MGNKASGPESSGYGHDRDELEYTSTPHPASSTADSASASPVTPLKRSQTVLERTSRSDFPSLPRTSSDAGSRQPTAHLYHLEPTSTAPSSSPTTAPTAATSSSTSTSSPITNATDKLLDHLVESRPVNKQENVDLGASIVVYFGKDVRTVNVNKLFEVECESLDPSFNPVKGRVSYDARGQRAEFTPQNTLFPNARYTVTLLGKAVTTTQCSNGANISNAILHFNTCNPAPKNVGIKLRGQGQPETLQIANYYDLYNSLILWSTKKWGCSGEHVTGLYHENDEGKLLPLKADHDVLGVVENGMIVVEIKD